MGFDISKRIKYTNQYKLKTINQITSKQVLWFIFDEYDPEYIKNNKFGLKLNNINNIIKNSLNHYNAYSPASNTLQSVPSTLMKIKTKGSVVENYQVKILNENNEKINFEIDNTLFKELIDKNFTFNIISEALPYCVILNINTNCIRNKNQISYYFDAIINNYLPIDYYYKFKELTKKRPKFSVDKINSFKNSNEYDLFLSKSLNIRANDLNEILNNGNNLIFFHLFLPHIDFGRDDPALYKHIKNYFNMNVYTEDEEYLLNLKYVDDLIEKIFEIVNKNNNEEILVLLTSDHWRRKDSPKKAKPSLFIAKIKNDSSKVEVFNENLNIFIPELIIKYLKEDIKSHHDIKLLLENLPKFNSNETHIN